MDNKKQPVNAMTEALKGVMKYANSFVKQAEDAIQEAGKGLDPEKKKEFDKALNEQGVQAKLNELREKMKNFKEVTKKVNSNGATNKPV